MGKKRLLTSSCCSSFTLVHADKITSMETLIAAFPPAGEISTFPPDSRAIIVEGLNKLADRYASRSELAENEKSAAGLRPLFLGSNIQDLKEFKQKVPEYLILRF